MARKVKPCQLVLAFRMSSHSKNVKGQGIFLGIPVINYLTIIFAQLPSIFTSVFPPPDEVPTSKDAGDTPARDRGPKKNLWVFHHLWRQPSPQKGENSGHDE